MHHKCKLGLLVTNMLLQTIKFGNKQCITTSTTMQILHLTILNLQFSLTIVFAHGNFAARTSWNVQFNFHESLFQALSCVGPLVHGTSIRQSSTIVLDFKAPPTPSIKPTTLTIEPPNIRSQEDSNKHPLLPKPISCVT